MIENMEIEIRYITDNTTAIIAFDKVLETVRNFEEAEEFIADFCDEYDINPDTLIVTEN